MGNNTACKIFGIGSIKFKLVDGSVKILYGVRYIPKLKRNLIPLGMLDSKGYYYKSQGGVLIVTKGALVIMKGLLTNGLYMLQGSAVSDDVAVLE